MKGKDKIKAALSPGGASEIPVAILYEGIYIRDHWDEATDSPWWYANSPDLEHQMTWHRDAVMRTGQDWMALPVCADTGEREHVRVEARDDGVFRIDDRDNSEKKLERPPVGGFSLADRYAAEHSPSLPENQEDIDAVIKPDPDHDSQKLIEAGRGDLARMLKEEFSDHYTIRHVTSPLWSCINHWGFEHAMTMISLQPELLEYACGRQLEVAKQNVKDSAALGADGIWIEECMVDMISPADFERLNMPGLTELIDFIRSQEMASLYYYTGNPAGKWEFIREAGADAVALEEGKKGFEIDIEQAVRELDGQAALIGNIDAIACLEQADEKGLEQEVRRQLAAGRANGGRFIMGLGSPVTPGTPVSRVAAFCEMSRRLGGEGTSQ